MTQRPVFLPSRHSTRIVDEVPIAFRWNPGFAAIQKKKNVVAFHSAAASVGLAPLLEVSTKSEEELGRSLSAFNLEVGVSVEQKVPVEVAYQGSKVFETGGPFTDLFMVQPREAKRDPRLRASGALVGFTFGGLQFPLSPPTAFYDWLFLRALVRKPLLVDKMGPYCGFTDIEFNPERSVNCQARSCATAVTLEARGELGRCAKSFAYFVQLLNSEFTCSQRGTKNQYKLPV